MKMAKNKLLATALIATALLAMFVVLRPAASDYIDVEDYCWIEGVLDSDTYELYPYSKNDLDVGFSKYGELIGYEENEDDPGHGIGVGLQYPGYAIVGTRDQTVEDEEQESRDPFANENIPVKSWIRGWYIDIKYEPETATGYREIWAFALFSDGKIYGGDWIHVPEVTGDDIYDLSLRPIWQEYPPYAHPGSAPHGGRKTNGMAETEDIDILYDGPREFVAVSKTRIFDYYGTAGSEDPLVDVIITMIFNKVSKRVILLKDVKRINPKHSLNIQFGNRGEWDFGSKDANYASYVHFYTDIPIRSGFGYDTKDFWYEWQRQEKYPKKWSTDEALDTTYGVDPGHEWHVDHNILNHKYAVAQVVAADLDYVGAVAVWPHPEFWSVQRSFRYTPTMTVEPLILAPISRLLEWSRWTTPPQDPADDNDLPDRVDQWITIDDMQDPWSEPEIPWLIYENDFELSGSTYNIYRMVAVYTITDLHDADDLDIEGEEGFGLADRIDREIQYQLDEVFDPWDIYQALHQMTKRWVQFFEGDDDTYEFELGESREDEVGKEIPCLPVWPTDEAYLADDIRFPEDELRPDTASYWPDCWDEYSSFTERVLVDGELISRWPYQDIDPIPDFEEEEHRPYYLIDFWDGVISFYEWDEDDEEYVPWEIEDDSVIKVLWSSYDIETDAEQWTYEPYEMLYDISETNEFPLNHDVLEYCWPYSPEVFIIDQYPQRLLEGYDYRVELSELVTVEGEVLTRESGVHPAGESFELDNPFVEKAIAVYSDDTRLLYGTQWKVDYCVDSLAKITLLQDIDVEVSMTVNYTYYTPAYIWVNYVEDWECKELDFKYHIPSQCRPSEWIEEKRHLYPEPHGPMDLAFLIDVTGSMWDELADFKAALSDILDAAVVIAAGDIRYSLVIFNGTEGMDSDYVEVVQDWTSDRSAIETAIMGLTAVGGAGGWCPEASDEALNTTVNELAARSHQIGDFSAWRDDVLRGMIIFTDAPPGGFDDVYQPADLVNAKHWADIAATKNIHISSICGRTTCDGAVTVEALQYYAARTGGVYIKLDGVDVAEAMIGGLQGLAATAPYRFTLKYPTDYIEKVWHHSEKALLPGQYVCYDNTITLDEPLPWNEWLWIDYRSGGWSYTDYFCGDGSTTQFDLRYTPTYGTLHVYYTCITEEIVSEPGSPGDGCIPLPDKNYYPAHAESMPSTIHYADWISYAGFTEEEFLCKEWELTRGNYVIHETDTCDELVLDQLCDGIELKIVYQVWSGRYEWATVASVSAAVDSLGVGMVTAAFKNKLIEIGIGGLDKQDTTWGPRVPWLINEDMSSLDALGRYHLLDDWCYTLTGEGEATSWPISSSNIITVGGPIPNKIAEYFNDFTMAKVFTEEGDGFVGITCWDRTFYEATDVDDRYGYAVISTYKDLNGTVGFIVYGWNGQDTYYASKWFDEHKFELQHINLHVTDIVLEIEYEDNGDILCPPEIEVVEYLGTISEKPQHDC